MNDVESLAEPAADGGSQELLRILGGREIQDKHSNKAFLDEGGNLNVVTSFAVSDRTYVNHESLHH